MTQEILYAIGKAPTGELVRADHADKSVSYTCPSCAHDFVLKRGSERRAHFAHKASNPDCKPETALHYVFKTLLFAKIQHHLEQQMPLEIQWCCSHCGGTHNGNLLRKTAEVKLEHHIGDYRPDIALFDADGSVVAVIEVVVTHSPEQEPLAYYKANKISVLSFRLKSEQDLQRLDLPVLDPDFDACRNPKCSRCGNHQLKNQSYVIDAECWKCKQPMKVGFIENGDFSKADISRFAKYGVFLKSHYSRTAERNYIANTCRGCGAFVGNHYLFLDYVATPYHRQEIDSGYFCPCCEE